MKVREAQRKAVAIWGGDLPHEIERATVTSPTGHLHGMGPLSELWVKRPKGGVQKWIFEPRPRLFYDDATPKRRLFILGGGYRVTPSGIVRDGAVGLKKLDLPATSRKMRKSRGQYVATHGGLEPREAVSGTWHLAPTLVVVGVAEKIAYRADRNDAYRPPGCKSSRCELRGEFNWRHEFGEYELIFGGEKPLVACDAQGKNLVLVGGDYSVKDGWIVG